MKLNHHLLLLLFCTQLAFSQSFVGYESDNFNGIHGVVVNPANVVYQRNKAEISYSIGATMGTDLVDLGFADVLDVFDDGFGGARLNGAANNQNNFYANTDQLGPSFVLDLYPNSFSVAGFARLRKISNYNNVNGNLFLGYSNGFLEEDFAIEQNNFHSATHSWGELGLTFGHELINYLVNGNEVHMVKLGATVKYLRGLGVELGYSENITGIYSAAQNQLDLNGDFTYLKFGDFDAGFSNIFGQTAGSGWGFDVGGVWEYRNKSSTSPDNREEDFRALSQYRLKLGVSVLDFGRISYELPRLETYELNGPVTPPNTANRSSPTNGLGSYLVSQPEGKLKMVLPTRLRLDLDWKIRPYLYLNLVHNMALNEKKGRPFNNNILNSTTLTLRYEKRNFISAYLPVTLIDNGSLELLDSGLDIGFGLNVFGFVQIGSGDIITRLVAGEGTSINTNNLYVGVKVPIAWSWFD